jgi:ATP-binding cassette subfamily B protein
MPLNQVSQQLTAILSALAGAERIFEIMDLQPESDDG